MYGTAKRLKFENSPGTARENIKFQQIIDQIGTYTYNAAQIISNCLADRLFDEQLNNYHPRINFTIKLDPKKWLDTKLICVYNPIANRKSTKLSIAWLSKPV